MEIRRPPGRLFVSTHSRSSLLDAMMPPMMMAPIVVVAPGAIVADATRALDGLYDMAARGRVVSGIIVVRVVIIRVVVPNTSDKDAPEVVPVAEPMASEAMTASESRPGTEPAAMNGRATVGAATKAVSTTTEAVSATAVPAAADFDRQPVGCGFVRRGGTRIDQRQCLRALAGGRQESQERSRRKAQESGQESRRESG